MLGVLLTAVQTLPFLYFLQHGDLTYRSGQALSGLPFWSLVTLVAPNASGLCIAGRPSFTGVNSVETVAFVGAAAIVLAIVGAAFGPGRRWPRGRGVQGFFVGAAVVILALGWGVTQFREVTQHLPVFADNFIGRIRSVLGFVVATLAAIGFDWVTVERGRLAAPDGDPEDFAEPSPVRPRWLGWGWAGLICAASAITGLLILRRARESTLAGGYWINFEHAVWIPLLLVAMAVVLVLLARFRPRPGQVIAFLVLPLLVAGQGAQFFHTVLPGDPKSDFYPRTATYRFLATHLGHDRYASSGLTMYPATSLYYGLRTPTGHFFYEANWVDLLKGVDPDVMASPTFADFTTAINESNAGHQPILDAMGVRYFVLPPGDLAGDAKPLPAVDGSTTVNHGAVSCTLPAQPLRGVTVSLTRALVPADATRGFTLHLVLRDGSHTIASGRYFDGTVPTGSPVSIAVAGEGLPTGGHAVVTLSQTGVKGGMSLGTSSDSLACAPVAPIADGLRIAYAGAGSIIYERLTAQPRIRWASRSLVITGGDRQVAALAKGVPASTVILGAGSSGGSGRAGSVVVLDDSGDRIAARVDASGAGFLTVADAMQQAGWTVTVDGKPSPLLPADHAMVAVAVPAGVHQIAFSYRAPDQAKGAVLTGLAGIAMVAIVIAEIRRRHRGRAGPRHRRGASTTVSKGA
jgi:hypothetical protein